MLHEEVVSRVREMLLDGTIRPGSRIAERELCDRLHVSSGKPRRCSSHSGRICR